MLVWLLMLGAIIVFWFAIPDGLGEKKKKLIFLVLSGVLVAFLMGSRSHVRSGSSDVYWYYVLYERTLTDSLEYIKARHNTEMGYLVITRFLANIIPWGQFIIYLEAVFTTLVMFWFIYRNSEDVFIGVIVYICTGTWAFFLSGFRQAFAICLCLIAFELMKKKKFSSDLIALGIIAFATLFHVTAWVFLFAFIIRNIKLNKSVVLLAVIATVVCFIALEYLVDIFEGLMESEFSTGYEGNLLGGIVPIATFLIALVLSYVAWTQDKNYIEKYNVYVLMLLMGLCLYLFRYNTMVFERISYYFTALICVVLPNSLQAIKEPRAKTVSKALCVVCCVVLFIYRMRDASDYYFYWQP